MMHPRALLEKMFQAAIDAAQPALCLPQHLPAPPKGRLVVLGAGKASAAMAKAVEDNWTGDLSGLVITRHGYEVACNRIEIVRASHPVPDDSGMKAAERMLALAQSLTADDLALCLISGGGSALMPLPMAGMTLADKQRINKSLLASGATISEINCVRRHISAIKGGRLAAACAPARVLTLLISDVPGDNPSDIASGPTIADPTTSKDAAAILQRYNIDAPPALSESVKHLDSSEHRLIATPKMALAAASQIAQRENIPVHFLGDAIEGEARELGASMARQALAQNQPCVLLSGGETTVTLRGNGRGGRNVEFLLSLAITLNGAADIYALAGDTDGVDGTDDIAGAYVSPDTLERAHAAGLEASQALENNDAHSFFEGLGDSIVTGPTRTNVNDFRAILIAPRQPATA
ncbi:MAG: glycerate kinase [bacterium]|nr:glycerate kinase [bacterium]